MLDQLWERKVLHAPIVYRPTTYPGGTRTALLEEVTPLWLAQASET